MPFCEIEQTGIQIIYVGGDPFSAMQKIYRKMPLKRHISYLDSVTFIIIVSF
jgi:hypothetical protein